MWGNEATVVEREGEMAFENVGKESVGPRRPRSTSIESPLSMWGKEAAGLGGEERR